MREECSGEWCMMEMIEGEQAPGNVVARREVKSASPLFCVDLATLRVIV